MTDYANILHFIESIRASPSNEEYNEDGFQVLRACDAHAQLLRAMIPHPIPVDQSNMSETQLKAELRR